MGFRTDFVTSVWVSDAFTRVLALAGLRPAGARKLQGGAPFAPPCVHPCSDSTHILDFQGRLNSDLTHLSQNRVKFDSGLMSRAQPWSVVSQLKLNRVRVFFQISVYLHTHCSHNSNNCDSHTYRVFGKIEDLLDREGPLFRPSVSALHRGSRPELLLGTEGLLLGSAQSFFSDSA